MYTNTNTNESMHSEIGPVRQNPIQRTVRTAHLSLLVTMHNHRNSDVVDWRRGVKSLTENTAL